MTKSYVIYLGLLIGLAFLCKANSLTAQVQLRHQYEFDNLLAQDAVGSLDGELFRVETHRDRFGRPDYALDFSAGSSYINFGNCCDFFSGPSSQFSLSLWIQSAQSGNELILNKYGNSSCFPPSDKREFFLRINSEHRIEFVYYGNPRSNNYRGVQSDITINDTCWHHVVVAYDGTQSGQNGLDRVSIYIDGQLTGRELSLSVGQDLLPIQPTDSHFSIGMSVDEFGRPCAHDFVGKLDELSIFEGVITQQEVDDLFFSHLTTASNNLAQFSMEQDTICVGQCIEFYDESAHCPESWKWQFGTGGPTFSGRFPTDSWGTTEGIYDSELEVDYIHSTSRRIRQLVVSDGPDVDLGDDLILCPGDAVILAASTTASELLWSDKSTGPTLLVDQPGRYWVAVSEGVCKASDTVQVSSFDSNIDVLVDTMVSCGESLELDVRHAGIHHYHWSDGATGGRRDIIVEGAYQVTLVSDCGEVVDSTYLVNEDGPLLVEIGDNQTICLGDSVVLDATSEHGLRYRWSNGLEKPEIVVQQGGIYIVEVFGNCHSIRDSVTITDRDCCEVYVPNAFSPNGDGVNDTFRPYFNLADCGAITEYRFEVYDRWGGKRFSSNQPDVFWDGGYQAGEVIDGGLYVWSLSYSRFGRLFQQHGGVILMR